MKSCLSENVILLLCRGILLIQNENLLSVYGKNDKDVLTITSIAELIFRMLFWQKEQQIKVMLRSLK